MILVNHSTNPGFYVLSVIRKAQSLNVREKREKYWDLGLKAMMINNYCLSGIVLKSICGFSFNIH